METEKTFTEKPEQELWRSILQLSCKSNILRYFEDNGIEKTDNDDDLVNCISGALLQADEYYTDFRYRI